jgi:HK97 family phage portal protein
LIEQTKVELVAFLGGVFKRRSVVEQKSLASPEAWLIELFGAVPSASGVSVTAHTAMRCPAVRCGVQAIAEPMGALPCIVYQRSEDGSKERAPDHPAYKLLHDEANPWTPASDLREQLTRDAILHGDGLAYIVRVNGKPAELIRLNPEAITIEADKVTGEPLYRNGDTPIPRDNILHIRAPSLDGLRGESLIKLAREAIGLALIMERHAAMLFGNGARPSGVLKFPNKLGDETATRIKTAWQKAHGGGSNGGTAVLEEGGDWQGLALTSVDAQFLELRKFAIEEIARALRVPPHMLFELGRATWSNSEQMRQDFLTFCLMTWIKRWEGEIRLKLFTAEERDTYFAEFLLEDFLRADFATRMDGYSQAIAARILNPNEARAAENRPPYAGGEIFENPNTTTAAKSNVAPPLKVAA